MSNGVFEFRDAFVLELPGHIVDADAQFRQSLQYPAGRFQILFEPGLRRAVVAVGIQGFQGDRVDRVGSDEGLDVFHVAVVRVLGTGAGPEQPLDPRAFRRQLPEPVAAEDFRIKSD